jgi:hypothetical protein
MTDDGYRYFLCAAYRAGKDEAWEEVTKTEFVAAERAAGFHNTMGRPDEPATGGFSGHGVSGRVRYVGGDAA